MQQAHEQCHICKKQQPDRFVYYKDYDELEGTFHHPSCNCLKASAVDTRHILQKLIVLLKLFQQFSAKCLSPIVSDIVKLDFEDSLLWLRVSEVEEYLQNKMQYEVLIA